jgi:hypothetical protein
MRKVPARRGNEMRKKTKRGISWQAAAETQRRRGLTRALTAETSACFGAGCFARCKPRLDAGALIAAPILVRTLHAETRRASKTAARIGRDRKRGGEEGGSREAVERYDGVAHDLHGEVPAHQRCQIHTIHGGKKHDGLKKSSAPMPVR